MPQQPEGGQAKGKLDLFDALKAGSAQDPGFSLPSYLIQIGREQAAGNYEVTVDEARIYERHKEDPIYKDSPRDEQGIPAALKVDVENVKSLAPFIANPQELARFYRAPKNYIEAMGYYPDRRLTETNFTEDHLRAPTPDGQTQVVGLNQQIAYAKTHFRDRYGYMRPVTSEDLYRRRFAAVPEMVVGPDGSMVQDVILQELSASNPGYGLDVISKFGPQTPTGTWLGAGAKKAADFMFMGIAGLGAAAETISNSNLKTMAAVYGRIADGRISVDEAERYLRGDFESDMPGVANEIQGVQQLAMMSQSKLGWNQASLFVGGKAEISIGDAKLKDLMASVEADIEGFRARAKKGERVAQLALDVYDEYNGKTRRGAWQEYVERYNAIYTGTKPADSVRASAAFYDNWEATFALFGQMANFILPQAGAARVLAGTIRSAGAGGLLTRSLVGNMAPTLNTLGQSTVAIGSAAVPTLMMGAITYQGAREAGYGHDEANSLALWSMPGIALTEAVLGGGWMVKSFIRQGGTAEARKLVAKTLMKDMGKKTTQERVADVYHGYINWLNKGIEGNGIASNIANRAKGAFEAFNREGVQEGLEELYYAQLEDWLDNGQLMFKDFGKQMKFAAQRPEDYSMLGRVFESALAGGVGSAPMGAILGGRRGHSPYDQSIATAVAAGKGKDVLSEAEALYKKGLITIQEFQIVQQDVALSQEVMRGLNIADPQTLDKILAEEDLAGTFTKNGMRAKEIEGQIAALQAPPQEGEAPRNEEATSAELATLNEELASLKKENDDITSGKELLRRYTDRRILVRQIEQKGENRPVSAAFIEHTTGSYRKYADEKRAGLQEKALLRETVGPELSKAIDNLGNSEAGKVFEALKGVLDLAGKLGQKNALASEDVGEIRSMGRVARSRILEAMSKEEFFDPTGKNEDVAQKSVAQAQEVLDEYGLDFETWFENSGQLNLMRSLPDSDSRRQLVRELDSLEGSLASLGETESDRDDFQASLSSRSDFESGISDEKLMSEFMDGYEGADGKRYTFDSVLKILRNKQELDEEEISNLSGLMDLMKVHTDSMRHMATTMVEVVDDLTEGVVNLEKPFGKRPAAFEQAIQDKKEVYDVAARLGEPKLSELDNKYAEIEREMERLTGNSNARRDMLVRVRRASIVHNSALAGMFVAIDPDIVKEEGWSATMSRLNEIWEEMQKAQERNPPVEYEVLVNRLMSIVSGRLLKDPSLGPKFLTELIKPQLEAKNKTIAHLRYGETKILDDNEFNGWYTEELFSTEKPTSAQLMARHHIAVNWLSRLSRKHHAEVVKAYAEAVGTDTSLESLAPHYEQQERIQEVVSFLANPDEAITDALTNAVYRSDKSGDKLRVPRSITLSGMPGVGKTKAVAASVIKTLAALKGGSLKVVVVAPGTKNSKELADAINSANPKGSVSQMTIEQLMGVRDRDESVDLVIFDEAHVMDMNDLIRMRNIMLSSYTKSAGLFMGDPAQVPSVNSVETVFPVQRSTMRTMPLQVSWRAGNPELLRVTRDLRYQVSLLKENKRTWPSLNQTQFQENNEGVRIINKGGTNAVLDAFAAHMIKSLENTAWDSNTMLVVTTEKDRDDAIAYLQKITGIPPTIASRVRTMDRGENSALGLETGIVFVAMDAEKLKENFGRFLYTAISRGQRGAVAYVEQNSSKMVSLIPPIPDGNDDKRAQWKGSREALAQVYDDLKNRVPNAGTVPPPVPFPDPTQDPAEDNNGTPPVDPQQDPQTDPASKDWPAGVKVHVNKRWSRTKAAASMPDLQHETLTVVRDENKKGGKTTVRRPNGDEITLSRTHFTAGEAKPKDPELFDDENPNEDTPEDNEENGYEFADENEVREIHTRASWLHDKADGGLIMTSAVYPATDDVSENEAIFSVEQPAFKVRMALLKLLHDSGSGSYTVRLIKRSNRKYTSDTGATATSGLEVHLNEGNTKVILLKINTVLKGMGQPTVKSFQEAQELGYTMIGGLYLDTKAKNTQYNTTQEKLNSLAFGADNAWPEGGTIPELSEIPTGELFTGLVSRKGEKSYGSLTSLREESKKKGAVISEPTFIFGAPLDGSKDLAPMALVRVAPFEGGPETIVTLRTVLASDEYYKALKERASSTPANISFKDLKNTEPYRFIQYNRSSILNEDGTFSIPGLDKFLYVKQGQRANGKFKFYPEVIGKDGDPRRNANLLGAIEHMQLHGQNKMREALIADMQTGRVVSPSADKIEVDNTQVNLPPMSLAPTKIPAITPLTTTTLRTKKQGPPRYRRSRGMTQEQRLTAVADVQEYFRRVFGDRFVDNKLEFKTRITDQYGNEAYGVMENARILLEAKDGQVVYGTDRHEAVHYVLDHLLDEESKRAILDEAARLYAKKNGISWWQTTDEQANEFIAEAYEDPSYDTNTIFGRFMKWLRSTLQRWGLYRSQISTLLYAIENGEYAGAPEVDTTSVTRYSKKKGLESAEEEEQTRLLSTEHSTDATGIRSARLPFVPGEEAPSYRDRNRLGFIFGNHATATAVIDEVAGEVYNLSPYRVPTEEALSRPATSLEYAIASVKSMYAASATEIDPSITIGEEVVHFDNMPPDQVVQLSDDDWRAYVNYQLSKQDVFGTVLQAAFPGIDVANMEIMRNMEEVVDSPEVTTDMDVADQSTAMVHNKAENTNPLDKQSGLTKLSIATTKIIRSNGKGGFEEVGSSSDVDTELLIYVAAKAAQFSSGNYNAMVENLRAIEAKDPDSKEGLIAGTLLRRYFSEDAVYTTDTGEQAHSYAYLMKYGEELMDMASSEEERAILAEHVNNAKEVMANVARSFKEMSATNRWVVNHSQPSDEVDEYNNVTRPEPKLFHDLRSFDSVQTLHRTMQDQLRRAFIPSGYGVVLVDKGWRSQFKLGLEGDPELHEYEINEKGVFASGKEAIVLYTPGAKSPFKLATKKPELIAGFMKAAGYEISARSIDYLVRQADNNEFSVLAKVIGLWGASVHAGVERMNTGTVNASSPVWKVIQAEMANGGVNMDGVSDILDRGLAEPSQENSNSIPGPAMFFAVNKQLAEIESRTRGTSYAQRMISPTGKVVYPLNMGTTHSLLLPAAADNKHSSTSLEQLAEDLLLQDPALRTSEKGWLNPLLDKGNNFRISNTYYGAGISTANYSRGASPNSMSDIDVLNVTMDVFLSNLIKSGRKEKLFVSGIPFGDRDAIVMYQLDQPLGDRSFFRRSNKEGYSAFTYDRHAVREWVSKAFDYRIELRRQSLLRWTAFTGTKKASEVAALLGSFSTPEGNRRLRQSPLVETRDYIIDKKTGAAQFGHAITGLDSRIYSPDNLQTWASKKDKEFDMDAFISKVYGPHMKGHMDMLEQKGYTTRPASKPEGAVGFPAKHKITRSSVEEVANGYFFLHHFTNLFAGVVVDGPTAYYKDAQDYVKRSVMAFSPGGVSMIGEEYMMPKMPKVAIIDEIAGPNGELLMDGQGYTTPWGWAIARMAFGGKTGLIKQSVNKRVLSTADIKLKYSEALVSPGFYSKNTFIQQVLRRSLMIPDASGAYPLLEVWESVIGDPSTVTNEVFDQATKAVLQKAKELDMWEDLTHLIVPPSGVKMGVRSVNYTDAGTENIPLSTVGVDARFWRYQTNLDRPIDPDKDSMKAPYFTQLSSLFGVSPEGIQLVDEIHNMEAELTKEYLKKLQAQIQLLPGTREEKVKEWLRRRGYSKGSNSGLLGQFIELIADPEVSVNNPVVRRKLTEMLANELTSNAINPRLKGQMFTQVSAHGLLVPEVTEQVIDPTEEDLANYSVQRDLAVQQSAEQENQDAVMSEWEAQNPAPASQVVQVENMRELLPPRIENGQYQAGEIMLPFVYAKRLGITNPNASMEEIKAEIKAKYGEPGLISFEQRHLNVYVARTPASSVGSGQWMKVVGFINDTGNSIYVPAGFNEFTGGDYDGDQLSVYFYDLEVAALDSEKGKVNTLSIRAGDNSPSSIQTAVLDRLYEYYHSPETARFNVGVGTQRLKQVVEELAPQSLTAGMDMFTPQHSALARKMASDGVVLIGIGAQFMKGYAMLSTAYNRMLRNGDKAKALEAFPFWSPVEADKEGNLVVSNIGEILNGALDNTKLMALGQMGVSVDNIGLLMGSLMYGKTLKEAMLILSNPIIRKLSQEASSSSSYANSNKEYSTSLLNLLDAYIVKNEEKVKVPEEVLREQSEFKNREKENRKRARQKLELLPQISTPASDLFFTEERKNAIKDFAVVEQAFKHASLGESVSAAAAIFSVNTKGVPYSIAEMRLFEDKFLRAAGIPLANYANGLREYEPTGSEFQLTPVLSELPNVTEFIQAVDWGRTTFASSFLLAGPAIKQLHLTTELLTGRLGAFRGDKEALFYDFIDEAVLAAAMTSQLQGKTMKLTPKYAPIDMSDPGGWFRYVSEFPEAFALAIRRVERLPASDPRKKAMKSNAFMQELIVRGNDMKRVEVLDGRKLMNDGRAMQMVRRAAERLDEIFTPDLMKDMPMPMSNMLWTYSMLKDKFQTSKSSISRFLPNSAFEQYHRFVEQLHEQMLQKGVMGTPKAFDDIPKVFITFNQDMVPVLTKGKQAASYVREKEKFGSKVHYKLIEKRTGHELISPWSQLVPRLSMSSSNVLNNVHKWKGFDQEHYRQLMTGNLKTVEFTSPAGWQNNSLVSIPTGDVLRVSMSNEGLTATVSGVESTQHTKSSDNQDPAIAHLIDELAPERIVKAQRGAYGAKNSDLDGKGLADVLGMIASRTVSSRNKKLAQFLMEQAQRFDRPTTFRMRGDFAASVGGRITNYGTIDINENWTGLDLEHAVLHEALHRFTIGVLRADPSTLSSQEQAYQEQVKEIYQQAKTLLGDSHYAMTDEAEFVAEVMSNERFQMLLRAARPEGKPQNLFWRIINAIRRLFGTTTTTNNDLMRVVSLTYDYINSSSVARQDRGVSEEAYLKKNAQQHGAHSTFGKVKDIRDLLDRFMTQKDALLSFEERDQRAQVDQVMRKRINWTVGPQNIDGVQFNITGKTQDEIRDYVREKVVPEVRRRNEKTKDLLRDVLTSGAITDTWNATLADRYPKGVLDHILKQVNHRKNCMYVSYSKLADSGYIIGKNEQGENVTVGSLGLKIPDGFKGFDPLLQITREIDGTVAITMVETIGSKLSLPGDRGVGQHMLQNYLFGPIASAVRRLTIPNDAGGARMMMMGLTAMAIKQANPKVAFRRMKVLSLRSDGVQHDSVWMPDFVHEARVMRETPAIMNNLPESIKSVLNDDKLYDGLSYSQSPLHQYQDFLDNAEPGEMTQEAEREYKRHRNTIQDAIVGKHGTDQSLLQAMKLRQRIMESEWQDMSKLRQDEEYRLIGQVISELLQRGRKNGNSNRDTSTVGLLAKNAHNVESDELQMAIRVTEKSIMKIGANMTALRNRMLPKIKALEKVTYTKYMGNLELVDRGWKRFERMWRTTEAVNLRGEKVQVKTNTIHWDKNDPETRKALASGQLTQAELDFANYLLDEVYDAFVDEKVHSFKQNLEFWMDGQFSEELARDAAKTFVSLHYARGWVPVVRRPSSEAISQGKLKEAAQTMWSSATNVDGIYAQDLDRLETQGINQLGNPYAMELEEVGLVASPFGNDQRLSRMGLRVEDGQLVVFDDLMNANTTMNLEVVATYLRLAVDRKRIHEEDSIPAIRAARMSLLAKEQAESTPQTNNLKYLEKYEKTRVLNIPLDSEDKFKVANVAIAPLANMALSATSFIGVAFNYKVAIASGVMNLMQGFGTAISSALANDGVFGVKEWTSALALMKNATDRRKMNALIEAHFVNEWQEQDLAQSLRKSHTRKLLFSGQAMNYGNFWTDHNVRGIVMVAQMLKDGSWDAYSIDKSGELKYDERKDRRWYDDKGKLTSDGKVLRDEVKRRLINDGIFGQKEDEPLKAGYDMEMGGNFKWIADKYIIGGMDKSQQAMVGSMWYGRMFTTFRTFMFDRIYNWHGRSIYSDKGGQLKVSVDPDTGEKLAVWEKRQITSYVNALASMTRELSEVGEKGWDVLGRMTGAERRMLGKLSYDMIIFALAYFIYNGITADDDDKEKDAMLTMMGDDFRGIQNKQYAYEKKLTEILRQVAVDGFSGSAPGLITTLGDPRGTIPVLNNVMRIMDLPWHPEKALYIIPGSGTIKDTWEVATRKDESTTKQ